MVKKELKMYEAPTVEVVEMKVEGMLCMSVEVEQPGEGNDW